MTKTRWALKNGQGKLHLNSGSGIPLLFLRKVDAQVVATYYKATVIKVFVSVRKSDEMA